MRRRWLKLVDVHLQYCCLQYGTACGNVRIPKAATTSPESVMWDYENIDISIKRRGVVCVETDEKGEYGDVFLECGCKIGYVNMRVANKHLPFE
jgi:hypothetical protein